MEPVKPWQLFLRLLIPMLWAVALHLGPRPAAYDAALVTAWQARLLDHPAQESQALQSAVALEPGRADLWERIGQLSVETQDWDQAIRAYRQEERMGALSSSGRRALGEVYWQQGEPSSAIEVWKPLMLSGEAGQELFQKVYDRQRADRAYSGAVQTLYLWKNLEPLNAEVLYNLGVLMLDTEPAQAIDLLDQAARQDTNLMQKVYALREAVEAQDRTSLSMGQALSRLGEWDQAELFFAKATIEEPDNPEAWTYLAESMDQMGESGIDAFQHALQLDPTSVIARAGAALHFRRQGSLDLALTYLKSLARQQPDKAVWQLEIGSTLAMDGELRDAMTYFQRALELEPDNAYYWSVVAAFSADNTYDLSGTGLPAARQALLLSPNTPEYLDLMGVVFIRLEDFTSAERFLQQALQKDAKLASAQLHLGQLYLQQGRTDLAYKSLTQAETLAGETSQIGKLAGRLLERYFP